MKDVLKDIEDAAKGKKFQQNIDFSSKLVLLMDLLKNLREEGHRVLVFSMSKKMLNIIEEILSSGYLGKDKNGKDVKHIRIDGNTEIAMRE